MLIELMLHSFIIFFRDEPTACAARLQLTYCFTVQLLPIVPEWQSDSGSFDAVLELLVHTGRELPETMVRRSAQEKPGFPRERSGLDWQCTAASHSRTRLDTYRKVSDLIAWST